MLKYQLTLNLFIALILVSASCQPNFVDKDQTVYTIAIENAENSFQVRAADMLVDYVMKLTGVEVPIRTFDPDHSKNTIRIMTDTSLHPDGYQLIPDEYGLKISGGSHKGCIYGVVYLLEQQWGIRKYSPSFEIIPESYTLRLPRKTICDEPMNNYRIINGYFSMDPDYQDWQATDVVQDQFANGYYVHTFNRLLPWQEYYEKHPEYYAEVNGKRIPEQLCLTNPEVLKLVIEKLRVEMGKQPEKVLWSVSQNDNPFHCQCAECSKIDEAEGAPSGSIIHFVNAIAREFPDKVISTLAYQYSRHAPKQVKPEPNVQVMLCTIELNRSKPIATDPASAAFVQDLTDWGAISNHIYLWDYTVDFAHQVAPFPNYHVLQPNIQLFYQNNVREHFQQSNTDTGHEFSELKSYLISHLLWNPYINLDSLINDFMAGYYGVAESSVKSYFKGLQKDMIEAGTWLDIYGHPTAHKDDFLAENKVNTYFTWFAEAREAVSDDSARLAHVREAELPLQYAAMEIGISQLFDSRGWYLEKDGQFVRNEKMFAMLDDFIETCRQIGVKSLNESRLTPEEYYKIVKRAVDVDVAGDLAFRKPVTAVPLPSTKYAQGDLKVLTDGVKGATDFQASWIGWEAQNFSLVLDLEDEVEAREIVISSLFRQNSWIFHPKSITCLISSDGKIYRKIGTETNDPEIRVHPVAREHNFQPDKPFRYVKFDVKGTIHNPSWHNSASGKSWTFIDEIAVFK